MNNLSAKIQNFKSKENFPVASIFLPKSVAKPILAFYNFARITDEIADSKTLSQAEKLTQLNHIYYLLQTQQPDEKYPYLQPLFQHTKNGNISIKNCLALIEAFIQDAQNPEYNNFDDVLKYCRKSAASVGRIVLEACGEYHADYDASDKICSVLQILNHLQDLKSDYTNLQRLYFAKNYFPNLEDLKLSHENIKVMEFKTEILNQTNNLLNEAKNLAKTICRNRVRVEIQTIINVCYALQEKLLSNNIMAKRVELTKTEKLFCLLKAIPQAIFQKPNFADITRKTKSSFFAPLLKLPKDKRQAMFAFYAFCHEIDDIVDEPHNAPTAAAQLNFWIAEIEKIYSTNSLDYPTNPIAKELMKYVAKYNLQKQHLLGVINGQYLDLQNKMLLPSDELFTDYCYKVASCVGLVCVNIFGYNPANQTQIQNFAINLGHALQIINIMRDIEEDAARGRIYLPASILQNTKLENITPENLHKNFASYKPELQNILQKMAQKTEFHFAESDKYLPKSEQQNMKVALLIRKVYEMYFNKMKQQNFIFDKAQIKLSNIEKLKLLLS